MAGWEGLSWVWQDEDGMAAEGAQLGWRATPAEELDETSCLSRWAQPTSHSALSAVIALPDKPRPGLDGFSAMERNNLKCNMTACRKPLIREGKAVVTNCFHIFCLDCANSQASLTQPHSYPVCPVCNTHLTDREDLVCTSLNPSQDYKSSVLSGLSPSVILEIAGRAMSFWSYQQGMESKIQAVALKQAQENARAAHKEKLVFESQSKKQIKVLVHRLKGAEQALSHARTKLDDLMLSHVSKKTGGEDAQLSVEHNLNGGPYASQQHVLEDASYVPSSRSRRIRNTKAPPVFPQVGEESRFRNRIPQTAAQGKSFGILEDLNMKYGSGESLSSFNSFSREPYAKIRKFGGGSGQHPEISREDPVRQKPKVIDLNQTSPALDPKVTPRNLGSRNQPSIGPFGLENHFSRRFFQNNFPQNEATSSHALNSSMARARELELDPVGSSNGLRGRI